MQLGIGGPVLSQCGQNNSFDTSGNVGVVLARTEGREIIVIAKRTMKSANKMLSAFIGYNGGYEIVKGTGTITNMGTLQ